MPASDRTSRPRRPSDDDTKLMGIDDTLLSDDGERAFSVVLIWFLIRALADVALDERGLGRRAGDIRCDALGDITGTVRSVAGISAGLGECAGVTESNGISRSPDEARLVTSSGGLFGWGFSGDGVRPKLSSELSTIC